LRLCDDDDDDDDDDGDKYGGGVRGYLNIPLFYNNCVKWRGTESEK
jgi:hypothetical protein